MVSTWWLIVAILGGGIAGVVAMALIQVSGAISRQPPMLPDLGATGSSDGLA
jgi:hypothetical protein